MLRTSVVYDIYLSFLIFNIDRKIISNQILNNNHILSELLKEVKDNELHIKKRKIKRFIIFNKEF